MNKKKMGILIISIVVVILCLYLTIKDPDIGLMWVFVILSAIGITSIFIANCAEYARFEAFYVMNKEIYKTTITDTMLILSVDQEIDDALIPVQGNIEKIGVGIATADRIKELRDAAIEYNNQLATFRAMRSNIFVNLLYPEISPNLKYLYVK